MTNQWKLRNPDRVRENSRTYRERNRDAIRSHKAQRRQYHKRHRVAWIDLAAVRRAYRVARGMREHGVPVHVDHWVPLKARDACGLHVHDNLALAHARDNLRKGSRCTPQGPPPAVCQARVVRVPQLCAGVVKNRQSGHDA